LKAETTKATISDIQGHNKAKAALLSSIQQQIVDLDTQADALKEKRTALIHKASTVAHSLGLTTVKYDDGGQLIYRGEYIPAKLDKKKLLHHISPHKLAQCMIAGKPIPGSWYYKRPSEKASSSYGDGNGDDNG
jgi:hypothetical protein